VSSAVRAAAGEIDLAQQNAEGARMRAADALAYGLAATDPDPAS
jgi:hypothetical protein